MRRAAKMIASAFICLLAGLLTVSQSASAICTLNCDFAGPVTQHELFHAHHSHHSPQGTHEEMPGTGAPAHPHSPCLGHIHTGFAAVTADEFAPVAPDVTGVMLAPDFSGNFFIGAPHAASFADTGERARSLPLVLPLRI